MPQSSTVGSLQCWTIHGYQVQLCYTNHCQFIWVFTQAALPASEYSVAYRTGTYCWDDVYGNTAAPGQMLF